MRKLIAGVLTTAFVVTFTPAIQAVSPVTGAKCAKIGATQIFKNKKFTCVKLGKKIVWNTGVPVLKTPTPASSPSPLPITTESSKPDTSSKPSPTPTAISDALFFKNPMIYGLADGVLTRKSDAGKFFNEDSRNISSFSTIRLAAFNELRQDKTSLAHPNVELTYIIRDSFPAALVAHSRRQIEEAAAFWSPYLPKKVSITVYLLTEKDREFASGNRWLANNLPQIFDRFDSKNERPFISGGGRYWEDNPGWSGKIFLATASYLDLNYVNYEWPQVAKHEFTHVMQDFFYSKDGRFGAPSEDAYYKVLPTNFMEGSANTFGYLTAFENLGWSADAMDWLVWARARNTSNWMSVTSEEDAIKMMIATEKSSPEMAFEMTYAIGALMFEWVLAKYGFKGYLGILNQLSTSESFDETLKKAIGLSKSEFYKAVAPYVLETFTRVNNA
jgi:hypothetical protein